MWLIDDDDDDDGLYVSNTGDAAAASNTATNGYFDMAGVKHTSPIKSNRHFNSSADTSAVSSTSTADNPSSTIVSTSFVYKEEAAALTSTLSSSSKAEVS